MQNLKNEILADRPWSFFDFKADVVYIEIEEIVVYPDALIEVKHRIKNRYRTAPKVVEDGQYPRVCSATAVHTLRRIIFPRKRIGTKTA